MGWINPDYHYLTVTSDAGNEQYDDPERTTHGSRSDGRHGRTSTLAVPLRDTSAGRLRLPCGLRLAAMAPPWRGGRSTSMSELVPPRSG